MGRGKADFVALDRRLKWLRLGSPLTNGIGGTILWLFDERRRARSIRYDDLLLFFWRTSGCLLWDEISDDLAELILEIGGKEGENVGELEFEFRGDG